MWLIFDKNQVMETQAVEIIETEVVLEEVMSMNHSRLIGRLAVLLSAYEEQYEILPELEFELSAGRLKPDVAIMPRAAYDWEADIIRCTTPPITAIEVLSPTQSFDFLVAKIRQQYFSSGVQSAWLVLPAGRTICLLLPGQPMKVIASGTLHDPAAKVDISLDNLFR